MDNVIVLDSRRDALHGTEAVYYVARLIEDNPRVYATIVDVPIITVIGVDGSMVKFDFGCDLPLGG